MTDPIGTAKERELIFRLRLDIAPEPDKPFTGKSRQTLLDERREAADALQSRIAEVGRLTERVKAAVNWVQPPFLTPEASPDEVRSRINLLLADIDAALSQHRKL